MAKLTVSGIALDTITSNHPRPITINEIWEACQAQGLNVSIQQVYAGVQSMASTRKIARGTEKGTFVRLGSENQRDETVTRDTEIRTSRRISAPVISGRRSFPAIKEDLTELIGEEMARSLTRNSIALLIDGSADAATILRRIRERGDVEIDGWASWLTETQAFIFIYVKDKR